jgi:hypothetical protein
LSTAQPTAEPRPFIEIDPRGDVGNIRREAAQRLSDDFADHREGKNLAAAADLHPVELVARAIAANRPRAENPRAAVPALLHHELAGFSAVPKRLVDGSDLGEGLFNCLVLICHNQFSPLKCLAEKLH